MFPDGYPDFPMPQTLDTSHENGTVRISCLVSDLCFSWRLRPAGAGTEISVHVEIPDREAARLDAQREIISQSLTRLADLAASQASPGPAGRCAGPARRPRTGPAASRSSPGRSGPG